MVYEYYLRTVLPLALVASLIPIPSASGIEEQYVNTLGMKLVRIEPGSSLMGSTRGDSDEIPIHRVTISRPFHMGATEVTNAQYEQFDPQHKAFRHKRGLSRNDEEAVVFVSWHEAAHFCRWLSNKESKPYRLPTEAEWEYACRAGTTTDFHTGDVWPEAYYKNQQFGWNPKPVDLTVGKTPPNVWGLYDMHGNVEEWCYDWYGPYEAADQIDPVGRIRGDMKVTRGGSHNTQVTYLRSANRLGTLPEDRHWMIGFRVVLGELSGTKPLPEAPQKLWARDVNQKRYDYPSVRPKPDTPYFKSPKRYVNFPGNPQAVPMYHHNHCSSITWCPNGDLLAVWFSTKTEQGREMVILGSRLRPGHQEWDSPSVFFQAPDRNLTGSSLWHDGQGTLFHFNGLEAAGGWANLALVMRTSKDNGVTWQTRLINPNHRLGNQVISGTLRTMEGYLLQPCDAVYNAAGGTTLHISRDGGRTWAGRDQGKSKPKFAEGQTGPVIAGIHAGVVQCVDGSLLSLGRNNNIRGRMPMSLSANMGDTWTYSAGEFPPIEGRQRLVLMRLREGPILFVSFTDASTKEERGGQPEGLVIRDATGTQRRVFGMFAALSFDEGKSWPVKKLITPGHPAQELTGGIYDDWRPLFKKSVWVLDDTHSEPMGYLAACQTPDGIIHLISTALHYEFNLAWLKTPPE